MVDRPGFIDRHGLWTEDQHRLAADLRHRVESSGIRFVRLAWADPHGASRAKMLTLHAFRGALENGHNINVATTTIDAAGARIFSSFTRGGGMGLEEMTGSPNLVVVPDPATFRILPWQPDTGWILGEEHFVSGAPFHFSPRALLRRQLRRLEERGMRCVVGLEVEWYLFRLAEQHLTSDHVGLPGVKGRPPEVWPMEPGFGLHVESHLDLMHGPLSAVASAAEQLGLPLRSIEKEQGPGQVECTFAPRPALEAADNLVLFRSATRQTCRRMGHLASFMCRPRLKGSPSSGWHLHQSLVGDDGENLFTPEAEGDALSSVGRTYLGGLLANAAAATVFAVPTVNGYRRFRPNSLAPDRLTWGVDHRGVLLRVLGGAGDPASRIENRVGEPLANPYLYIASQIAAGLDGIDAKRDPGSPDTDPYTADRPLLPSSLAQALEMLEAAPLFRDQFGNLFIDYYLALKRTELGRFQAFVEAHPEQEGRTGPLGLATTEWEHDEYFDFL